MAALIRFSLKSSKILSRLPSVVSSRPSRGFADASGMPLTFSSPYESFYNQVHVKQVDVPSFSGSFGILPNHVPSLAVFKPGVVTVYENDGAVKKFFVSSGSIAINDDSSVQLLAEEAVPIDNLDRAAANECLNEAQRLLSSATTEEAKAEAQIAVETSEALVKACE